LPSSFIPASPRSEHPSPGARRVAAALAVVLAGAANPVLAAEGDPAFASEGGPVSGTGWTPRHLDLIVTVERDPPALTVAGAIRLRFDGDPASPGAWGPGLAVNTYQAPMRWTSLEAPPGATVVLDAIDPDVEGARLAHVRLPRRVEGGHELTLRFELTMAEPAMQLVARDDVALASWIHAWYPIPVTGEGVWDGFTAGLASIPGSTVLDLPPDWTGITDGARVSRRTVDGRTRERWELGETPVARSFAVGPYEEAISEVDGRTIRIALLGKHPISPERLASLLGRAMVAAERRLGPFPFAGYGVVEVPDGMSGWNAASQQTFIMAESQTFAYDHGNLPLWAHEMSHGWWGNTVGTAGPGAKMAGEALAQLGVLLALEEIEGEAAMIRFLEESRSGYSSLQCARGYVTLLSRGIDHPLATLGDSELSAGDTHSLADSKGMWVWHMLRRRIGDERFFGTLRSIIDEYAGARVTLDDLRAAFVAAAPGAGLVEFFARWLDRPGLPRITPTVDGDRVVLTQSRVEPFDLDLEIEVRRGDGSVTRHRVAVSGPETVLEPGPGAPITGVELDPDRDLLLWRPAYGDDGSTAAREASP